MLWNQHDTLVGTARCGVRQRTIHASRHVDPDHRVVASTHPPYVRAALCTGTRPRAAMRVGMGIGANTGLKSNRHLVLQTARLVVPIECSGTKNVDPVAGCAQGVFLTLASLDPGPDRDQDRLAGSSVSSSGKSVQFAQYRCPTRAREAD